MIFSVTALLLRKKKRITCPTYIYLLFKSRIAPAVLTGERVVLEYTGYVSDVASSTD